MKKHAAELNPNRNYSVDLLRIITMWMVIVLHVYLRGGITEATSYSEMHYWSARAIRCFCICAVNIFGLISGYVGYKSKWKLTNIFVLWLTVAFYSVAFEFIFRLIAAGNVDLHSILWAIKKAVLAINGTYWFFKAYFLMFFFVPFMNKAVASMNFSEHGLAAALLTLTATAGSVFFYDIFSIKSGYHALWLAILYIDGAFLAKYQPLKKLRTWQLCLGYLICFAVKLLSEIFDRSLWHSGIELNYASLAVLGEAVFALTIFVRISLSDAVKRIVAFVSPLAFSVYLIHDNDQLRELLIKDRFSKLAYLPSGFMILGILISALAIFIICAVIDFVRKKIFDFLKIKQRASAIEDKLRTKIGLTYSDV